MARSTFVPKGVAAPFAPLPKAPPAQSPDTLVIGGLPAGSRVLVEAFDFTPQGQWDAGTFSVPIPSRYRGMTLPLTVLMPPPYHGRRSAMIAIPSTGHAEVAYALLPPEVLAAGDPSLTTGIPAASYPAGTYQFLTNILVMGAEPNIDRGAFPLRLAQTIGNPALGLSGVVAAPATIGIVKGAWHTESVPWAVLRQIWEATSRSATGAGAAVTLLSVLGLAPIAAPTAITTGIVLVAAAGAGTVGYRLAEDNVAAWWVNVTGTLVAAGPWDLAALNHAIANALASVTTWGPYINEAYRPRLPTVGDGSQLFAALLAPDACEGGGDLTNVYGRACTRVIPVAGQTTGSLTPIPHVDMGGAPKPPDVAPVVTPPAQIHTPPSQAPAETSWWPVLVVGAIAAGVAVVVVKSEKK